VLLEFYYSAKLERNVNMGDRYYSERVLGDMPLETEEISATFWGGFVALIKSRSREGWFAERYPKHCFEAPLPVDTDSDALGAAFVAHNPRIPWPFDPNQHPPTLDVLDAVEFFAKSISKPVARTYHDYGRHNHILSFDRNGGVVEYVGEVNTMLRRCGHPYRTDGAGKVQRLGPTILRDELAATVFSSGDLELDRMLELARRNFLDPSLDIRRESLEKLWDAWERLKTLLPGDKKTSVKALLDLAIPEPTFRERVDREATELTSIGNAFMIRHSETNKVPIRESEHVDYLFHRMFSLVLMLLRIRAKVGA
jgi:hypothetical protein